ncbi:prepilin-type N-terminal cleavage/methylation domain-containing protein [bacterium]|nr:prepilin-type N-terminal cleavage/methylation domain-containing protein [bacterium]
MSKSHGFSLIELLVVIGIIAIIAAVLAPVYIDAKRSAVRSACQSNLSQISKGFDMYLSDHNGCYPCISDKPETPYPDPQYLWAGANWREPFRKYAVIGSISYEGSKHMILTCPSDPNAVGIYAGTSYAYSASFYMTPSKVDSVADCDYLRSSKYTTQTPEFPCTAIKSSQVRFVSKKVLVAEYWTLHSSNNKVGWYDDPATTGNDPWSGARNCLFPDGHVKFVPTKQIHPATSPLVTRPRLLPDINLTRNGIYGKDID